MGLVSTWLNGIGLNSVAPTFEAAGIVTPSHLAELDVSYFESLGVTDPDDRRKLFYLVQRIKMAVNKKSPKRGDSVEERVDAIISDSFTAQSSSANAGYNTEKTDVAESVNITTSEEQLSEKKTMGSLVNDSEPRRSRRLAAKTTKENLPIQIDDNIEKAPDRGKALAGCFSNSGRSISIKSEVGQNSSSPKSPINRPVFTSNIARENSVSSPRGGQQEGVSKLSNTAKRKSVNKTDVSNAQGDYAKTKEVEMDSLSTSLGNSSESGVVIQDSILIRSKNSNLGRPRQSKLPGSLRTGKGLSVIPSETVPPLSPLGGFSSSELIDEIEKETRKEHLRRKKRTSSSTSSRLTALSVDSDSLEELLQSSLSESSEHSTSLAVSDMDGDEGVFKRRLQGLNKRRSKSMSKTELTAPQQQPSHLKRSSTSTSTRISRPSMLDRRPSPSAIGSSDCSAAAQSKPSIAALTASTRASAPIVVGMSESESWATKIGYLREDNRAEHDLFRDQKFSQEQEYYDMRIKVIVRKRPLSNSEANLTGGVDIIHPLDYGEYGRILVYQPRTRVDLTREVETVPFAYDNVFDESSTNLQIYERSLRNLISPFFEGQWATCFAYGQTGSGKTYTMMGSNITGINAGTATKDEANLGLYYLAALDIFAMKRLPEYNHLNVHISLFEIYGGKLFDLLNERKQVKCLEDSRGKVCFPGLTEHPVRTPEHVMELIEEGAGNRSTGTTSRNADSSRSHAVLQIKLTKNVARKQHMEHARFNFIDLAGSERGADTSSASRATRLEGAEINTSLLALKEVIRALATGGSMTHIPFRGSKLTQVLKDSFVGENTRCCMVACISPDIGNCEQTLNTLRYADRVKERNPESGVLSSSCQQPIKVASIQPFRQSSRSERDVADSGLAEQTVTAVVDVLDESVVRISLQNESPTAELESMLPSPQKAVSANNAKATAKQKAGEALVAEHRTVMASWLSMVKNEMVLVNEVDADRDGLDQYLAELQKLQSTQLVLISRLRESLHQYVSAAEGPQIATDESDDDSFEDLRD